MVDGNSNMKNSDLKTALENLALTEVLLKKHGLNGPSTFRRNNSKHPIDGIWASPNICLNAGGNAHYNKTPGTQTSL
jgi:hypothetical protein